MQLLTLAILLVIGVQLASTAANQCYTCQLIGCSDKFDANAVGVTKVPAINGWCLKIKGKQGDTAVVVRSADPGVCSKNKCEKQTTQGVTGTSCCCNTDLCNAAPRAVSTSAISFVVSLVALGFGARFYY